jgi:hypothetical protein
LQKQLRDARAQVEKWRQDKHMASGEEFSRSAAAKHARQVLRERLRALHNAMRTSIQPRAERTLTSVDAHRGGEIGERPGSGGELRLTPRGHADLVAHTDGSTTEGMKTLVSLVESLGRGTCLEMGALVLPPMHRLWQRYNWAPLSPMQRTVSFSQAPAMRPAMRLR